MNETERLLQRDRQAPIPEVPDPAYTAAVVATRVGRLSHQAPAPPHRWLLPGAAAAVALGLAGLALLKGAAPYWLMTVPLLLVPLIPILRKGAR